ncbi:hypothetical protein HYW83_00435 [Candidatus Peregrinibacteria bacterium]|nr:hypothetical protein [Candidatus Peregrinibacteria bacterium]
MPPTSQPFEAGEEILVDGRSDVRLEAGDHLLFTLQGITLRVRRGCVLVGVEEGFDLIKGFPFHASVQLNPGGVGRFRVQPGQHVVFDVKAAA